MSKLVDISEKQHEFLCKCKPVPHIELFTLSKMVTDRFRI